MIIATLLVGIAVMSMHSYAHITADSWLLKDGTKANKVMESENEFHSVC